jgi:hypothetical protein
LPVEAWSLFSRAEAAIVLVVTVAAARIGLAVVGHGNRRHNEHGKKEGEEGSHEQFEIKELT